ncbi:MAG TPA: SHOCT domain-containing protein [Gaiellaceae bacterium]|nr:SHOCT domain-containing protein [Gaiellaceae bacterium]
MVGQIIGAMFLAFITGALARFALPGPDPMPPWLTIAIGLAGTAIGAGIVLGIGGRHAASWSGLASFVAAVVLVVIYRRFVQKRPVWGRDAYRFPERGFGVEQYRERLKRAGIDPDQIGIHGLGALQPRPPLQPPFAPAHARSGDDPSDNPAHFLGLLEELHDSGVLEDDEYTAARTRLLESLRT